MRNQQRFKELSVLNKNDAICQIMELERQIEELKNNQIEPAKGGQEIFKVVEELLDLCTRGDAIKNNCRRCMDYYKYKDSRLSV